MISCFVNVLLDYFDLNKTATEAHRLISETVTAYPLLTTIIPIER